MEEAYFSETVHHLNSLRNFLNSAPSQFGPGDRIRRHELPNSDVVSCIKWDEEFFISGTDILRCIVYRFQALGREVVKRAKFEEFVFSDLRSLKTNVRARLEEGKSELLVFLHDYGCIRTKKKQRVFFWDAVPHDQLFLDTLERELRRAVIDAKNQEYHISRAVREPAISMKFDPLHKVGYQIDSILSSTPENQKEIICAVFGIQWQALSRIEHGFSAKKTQQTQQTQQQQQKQINNQPQQQQIQPQPPPQHPSEQNLQFPLHRALISHNMGQRYTQIPYSSVQRQSQAPQEPHVHLLQQSMQRLPNLRGKKSNDNLDQPTPGSLPRRPHVTSSSMPHLIGLETQREKPVAMRQPLMAPPNQQTNPPTAHCWHTQSDPGFSLSYYAQTHPENRTNAFQPVKADSLRDSGDMISNSPAVAAVSPDTQLPQLKRKPNVELPSIRDALPMHAQFDLGIIPQDDCSRRRNGTAKLKNSGDQSEDMQ